MVHYHSFALSSYSFGAKFHLIAFNGLKICSAFCLLFWEPFLPLGPVLFLQTVCDNTAPQKLFVCFFLIDFLLGLSYFSLNNLYF